jgi:hypothetical protein
MEGKVRTWFVSMIAMVLSIWEQRGEVVNMPHFDLQSESALPLLCNIVFLLCYCQLAGFPLFLTGLWNGVS